ncbi:hypothetical protein MAPG_03132 [Magnaporthiopsis poae ATCC 64411]|uniref:Uncharacterized protein n=1 Tax=Magnaporthiopsis poae (strain ATCC 64411 / 73-15) TaxID=644358 RepID=A0A0C4DT73_MAGP6|nr:hypothetical protein MAPG_03132 [Magnaporthiopsis poae ATCC 64411]
MAASVSSCHPVSSFCLLPPSLLPLYYLFISSLLTFLANERPCLISSQTPTYARSFRTRRHCHAVQHRLGLAAYSLVLLQMLRRTKRIITGHGRHIFFFFLFLRLLILLPSLFPFLYFIIPIGLSVCFCAPPPFA